MSHAFVSYVREDSPQVDEMVAQLRRAGAKLWLDRNDLSPGEYWKTAISRAVHSGSYFLACFSPAYQAKSKSYMNEELSLAIEELRLRPQDLRWFIPVLFEGGQLPAWPIRAGQDLRDIQAVSLSEAGGIDRLIRALGLENEDLARERFLIDLLDSKFPDEEDHARRQLKGRESLSLAGTTALLERAKRADEKLRASLTIQLLAFENLSSPLGDQFVIDCVDSEDKEVRAAAIQKAIKHGLLPEEWLLRLAGDANQPIAVTALEAMHVKPDTTAHVWQAIARLTSAPHKRLRDAALSKTLRGLPLNLWRHLDAQQIEALVKAIADEPKTWNDFLRATLELEDVPGEFLPAIIALMGSDDLDQQESAARLSLRLATGPETLLGLLRGEDDGGAVAAAYVLGCLGDKDEAVTRALAFAARFSPDPERALAAATALRRLTGIRTRQVLERCSIGEEFKTIYGVRERKLRIVNRRGLDARPAAKIVTLMSGFNAEAYVSKDGNTVSAKSIMGLMMLGAAYGDDIVVGAAGPQSIEALEAIEDLVTAKFHEAI